MKETPKPRRLEVVDKTQTKSVQSKAQNCKYSISYEEKSGIIFCKIFN